MNIVRCRRGVAVIWCRHTSVKTYLFTYLPVCDSQAPRDHVIRLNFVGDFGIYCINRVCFHWVEVKYKADLGLEGPR